MRSLPSPLVALALFVVLTAGLGAQEAPSTDDEAPPFPTGAEVFVPGLWQWNQGDRWTGLGGMVGTAVSFAPLLVPSGSSGETEHWVVRGGQHYVAWNDPAGDDFQAYRLPRAAAITSGLWGGLLSAWAEWDLYSSFAPDDRWAGRTHLTLGDYLAAPFQAEQVFNWDVIPIFPLLEFSALSPQAWSQMGRFFDRPSVNFLGYRVKPTVGLGLTVASSMFLVAANATVEEITYRGLYLDQMGVVGSSVFFGSNHLINALVLPNFSLESAGVQSVYATLFGLYAASRTEARGGDFRPMIALHYWHNVASFVLGYLTDPEETQLFTIAWAW